MRRVVCHVLIVLSVLAVGAAGCAACDPSGLDPAAAALPGSAALVFSAGPEAEPTPESPPPPPDHCTDYEAMEAGHGHPTNQDWFDHLDARGYARVRAACVYGWGTAEWECLDGLWQEESGWDHRLRDGIPQAQPASKMGNVEHHGGPDWRTNPRTQVRWGLDYIATRPGYGRPTRASLRDRPCHAGY